MATSNLGRWLIRAVKAVAAAYVTVLLVLFLAQRTLLYPAGTVPPDIDAAGLTGVVEAVHVTTSDGLRLLAWYRPPRSDGGPIVIYLHGNAGTIAHRGPAIRPLTDAGYGLLLVEYRGYGGNPGRPTEAGLYTDARAALDFVDAMGIGAGRQILYGESLGTGVAVQMAMERGAAALVLASPYTSIADVAGGKFPFLPVGWLLLDRYDSLAKIGRLRLPILVIHGGRDRTIPAALGRALYDAAVEPKTLRLVPEADHNDLNRFGAPATVLEFLVRHELAP